jgi:hypothetical protein
MPDLSRKLGWSCVNLLVVIVVLITLCANSELGAPFFCYKDNFKGWLEKNMGLMI